MKPYSRFVSGAEGGWGAFELVARYQENEVDRSQPGAFRSGTYAFKARSAAVGLNWYLNEASRLAVNYEYTKLDGGTLDGRNENFLVARYQLAF